MNFQKIPPVETSKHFLDLAFRKAREKGRQKKLKGNWLQIIRLKEAMKLDIIKDSLVVKLEKILESFPRTENLPLFYIKLMRLTFDYTQFKKSLGAVNWAVNKIQFFHKSYIRKIPQIKVRNQISELMRQFYGRISSIMKQIDVNLRYLESCRKIMKSYPDIKDMFTVCLYGLPNVGKTTVLNKLTGTKAKIAAYAFTTKGINVGYIEKKVQVIDVPGTLAREEKMNNIELQAELVMTDLANLIVYIFDLSGYSGYSIKKQERLFKKLGKKRKVLIYLSKKDLTEREVISEFKHKHYSLEEIKEKIVDGMLNFKKD